jgi:hypothetical protein
VEVFTGVTVLVGSGVLVEEFAGVFVEVAVLVDVGSGVLVEEFAGVFVEVAVLVDVKVEVFTGVTVLVGSGVTVLVEVKVEVAAFVKVKVGLIVLVSVAVGAICVLVNVNVAVPPNGVEVGVQPCEQLKYMSSTDRSTEWLSPLLWNCMAPRLVSTLASVTWLPQPLSCVNTENGIVHESVWPAVVSKVYL